ncbi:Na(+) H(+) antiporter subunit C [Vibrio maritimus]|uniref:Na(+) H(+) antiporter subunit C n=1 Tax=Vibrio maritimus TaxID=990268 RepID=A0A090T0P6_9VIBR|nr:Na(+) H(+) antiporter subunit C [Vibrio maritimus]
MEILWSTVIGVFVAAGVYLMLERHFLRVIFGLILLSNAVNLAIFTSGRLNLAQLP